jgi:hypothetical protein
MTFSQGEQEEAHMGTNKSSGSNRSTSGRDQTENWNPQQLERGTLPEARNTGPDRRPRDVPKDYDFDNWNRDPSPRE